jgi:hypothetical protein
LKRSMKQINFKEKFIKKKRISVCWMFLTFYWCCTNEFSFSILESYPLYNFFDEYIMEKMCRPKRIEQMNRNCKLVGFGS